MVLQEVPGADPSKSDQVWEILGAIAYYLSITGHMPIYLAYGIIFWVIITLILIGVVIIEGFIRLFRWMVIVGWVIIAVALAIMIQFAL